MRQSTRADDPARLMVRVSQKSDERDRRLKLAIVDFCRKGFVFALDD